LSKSNTLIFQTKESDFLRLAKFDHQRFWGLTVSFAMLISGIF
jgi:hypothetical protein